MQYGFMDELLGFIVLSAGPLSIIVVVAIGFLAIRLVTRGMKAGWKKWVASLLAALIVVLILTWDVIAGRAHFKRLCSTEGGIRVYGRVNLDPEYGDIQFSDNPMAYERMPIAKRYPYRLESSDNIPGPAIIKFTREYIRDGQTGEVLGTITHYFFGGGWFENAISNQAGGGSCGDENGGFDVLLEQIFGVHH